MFLPAEPLPQVREPHSVDHRRRPRLPGRSRLGGVGGMTGKPGAPEQGLHRALRPDRQMPRLRQGQARLHRGTRKTSFYRSWYSPIHRLLSSIPKTLSRGFRARKGIINYWLRRNLNGGAHSSQLRDIFSKRLISRSRLRRDSRPSSAICSATRCSSRAFQAANCCAWSCTVS